MATVASASGAPEGKENAGRFQRVEAVETDGKRIAIACLNAAIESFLVARVPTMSRAQLAEDLCGMSESNFSKVVNGVQGDFWALVYKLPGEIRGDFYERLRDTETVDPVLVVTEQLIHAAFRFLQIAGATSLPHRASAMVKAASRERKQRSA